MRSVLRGRLLFLFLGLEGLRLRASFFLLLRKGMFRAAARVTFSSAKKSPSPAQEPPAAVGLRNTSLRLGENAVKNQGS